MITFHADKMHITGPGIDGGYVVKFFVGEYEKEIVADLVRDVPIAEVLEITVDIYDPDKKAKEENLKKPNYEEKRKRTRQKQKAIKAKVS